MEAGVCDQHTGVVVVGGGAEEEDGLLATDQLHQPQSD